MRYFITFIILVLVSLGIFLSMNQTEGYLADYMKYSWCACRKIDPSDLTEPNLLNDLNGDADPSQYEGKVHS
jgi:hypothetical protein